MYLPGQIVYDLDKKQPVQIGDDVWDVSSYPERHTHFIKGTDEMKMYEIAFPSTIEEAQDLLGKNLITPAPCSPSHCWKCGNWKSNCKAFAKCSESSSHAGSS